MRAFLILLISWLTCSCGTNPEWVGARYAKLTNSQLLQERVLQQSLMGRMHFGVPDHMHMQSRLLDEEIQRRGITGPGLPLIAPPLREGESEDFGLNRELR